MQGPESEPAPTAATDINKNVTKSVHGTRIYRRQDYYFIRDGDFDIVWRNVAVFLVGHLMWAYGLYLLVSQQLLLTWIYCESRIDHRSFLFLSCLSYADRLETVSRV